MGVLPLQFYKGDSAEGLALRGTEQFSVAGIDALNHGELPNELTVVARADDGSTTEFRVMVRIDTPMEAEYFRHGGILPYVLRQLAS
jgi:aconitate hydratase